MDYGILGTILTGGFFVSMWKLGRWSVKHKIQDLEVIKEQLILSQDNHSLLIDEIDDKIQEIKDFDNLSIFAFKKDYDKFKNY
jgi:hypothetical protein